MKRSPSHIRQIRKLGQKSGSGLNRKLRRGIASRHADRSQPGSPFESRSHAANEELAAPDRAVAAIAGPVKGYADHRFVQQMMFGHHAGDVGVMMLHGNTPQS